MNLLDNLQKNKTLKKEEFITLLEKYEQYAEAAKKLARETAVEAYGNKIYLRGLIEFTSYCKNNCYYCGLRCSNKKAERYRLTPEQIFEAANEGYSLGFRTFVLQGGEDPVSYTHLFLVDPEERLNFVF